MNKTTIPWILSLLALGIAVSAHFRSPTPVLSNVGRSQEEAMSPPANRSASAPEERPANPQIALADRSNPTAELMPLLVDMQDRLRSMESRMLEMKPGWENLALRGMVRLSEEELADIRLRATNPTLSDQDRLNAFQILRRQNGIDDHTAAAMAQLAQTSTDPQVRERLFQGMEGLTNAVLKGPLLAALSSETNPNVRQELVEALGGMRAADPEVEAWLRHLAANDEDEAVQREARESLNERLRYMPVDSLQNIVLQSALSPQERLEALERLRREDARSPEVVLSMLDLYATSQDPRIRAEVFEQLDGVNDPAMRDPLIIGLAEDPDARVRRRAASNLQSYASDPDVRAWLEYVAQNDQDAGVRREATRALRGGDQGGGRR